MPHLIVGEFQCETSAALDLFGQVNAFLFHGYRLRELYATAPTLDFLTDVSGASSIRCGPVTNSYWRETRCSACARTFFTSLLGIANPIPTLPADISLWLGLNSAELMPMMSP